MARISASSTSATDSMDPPMRAWESASMADSARSMVVVGGRGVAGPLGDVLKNRRGDEPQPLKLRAIGDATRAADDDLDTHAHLRGTEDVHGPAARVDLTEPLALLKDQDRVDGVAAGVHGGHDFEQAPVIGPGEVPEVEHLDHLAD